MSQAKDDKNNKDNQAKKVEKKEEVVKKPVTLLEELRNQVLTIEKAISQSDLKTVQKTCKGMRRFKKYLKSHHFAKIWAAIFPNETEYNFESFEDFDKTFEENFDISKKKVQRISKAPEFDFFFKILLLCYFLQTNKVDQAYDLAGKLFNRVSEVNKKHFEQLSAFVYFYYARTRELKNQIIEIREELFEAYRLACIKHNDLAQATLVNSILRNYLHYNHYEAAQHFVSKITFPENISNNELIRFLYYTGRIKAVQVEYSEAFNYLNQALKKSPDNSALGFRIEAQKLAIIVEFLMGNIPSRDIFTKQEFWKPLYPYYKLVQSVLRGNLLDFNQVVSQYSTLFIKDKNYTLIQRLQQTVIKTGLRKINLSYSRISFTDIAQKLDLKKNSDVEFIIAKAIRDGILNAKIDHENQHIVIKQENDIYSTNQPQDAFAKRVSYCLNLHNSATKALQYPDTNYQYQNKSDDENDDDEDIDIYKIMEEDS
ncbi:hypothetical protein ABPG72_007451 [Tetrahymena utriculariae]